MASLMVGFTCLVLGFAGLILWFGDVLAVFRGALPPVLLLVGALAIFLGYDTLREKTRREEPAEGSEATGDTGGKA